MWLPLKGTVKQRWYNNLNLTLFLSSFLEETLKGDVYSHVNICQRQPSYCL